MKYNMTPVEMLARGKALETTIRKLGYNAQIDSDKMMKELCDPDFKWARKITVVSPEVEVQMTIWDTGECKYNVRCKNPNTMFELTPSKHRRILRAGANCVVDNNNYASYAYGLSSKAFRMLLNHMYNM